MSGVAFSEGSSRPLKRERSSVRRYSILRARRRVLCVTTRLIPGRTAPAALRTRQTSFRRHQSFITVQESLSPPMLAIHPSNPRKCTPNLLPARLNHNGPINDTDRYWKSRKDGNGTSYVLQHHLLFDITTMLRFIYGSTTV